MLLEDLDTHCPVHGNPLNDGVVMISYGLFRYSEAFNKAHRYLFPKSKFMVRGGCAVNDEIIYHMRYCNACRRAHLLWAAENKSNEGLPHLADEFERILHLRFGMENSVTNVPPDVHDLMHAHNLVDALKLLQRANPGVEIPELRAHMRYLSRGAELEQAILAMRMGGPQLVYEQLAALAERSGKDELQERFVGN
ncbi:hypothetical protein CR152_03880 [Massilia violaceinigra]|uniref:Uncharacterized protein n=1 Tax=Massilia violaceinigra TaxID=2045208 RepID=A0A2D2DFI8_9BURK|nr:hypothetical protein [Massilia violaceinigra]ATQ73743.1 hypothetical protein CR152_03880 [Massilia violaceinigra]